MTKTTDRQRQKKSVKSDKLSAGSVKPKSVMANSDYQKGLILRAWEYYQNQFSPSASIESFCQQNGVDYTYVGISDGEFHSTLSKRDKSFAEFKKLGILDKEGKDNFTNHIVVPVLEEMDVVGLQFTDSQTIEKISDESEYKISVKNHLLFDVEIGSRLYRIQGLKKSLHEIKATIKFYVGNQRHIDVINLYSEGNRKRLITSIAEKFHFPYQIVLDDIEKLIDICEEFGEDVTDIKISDNSLSVLETINTLSIPEFTLTDIVNENGMHRETVKRSLNDLINLSLIKQTYFSKPFRYSQNTENTNNTFKYVTQLSGNTGVTSKTQKRAQNEN